MDALRSRTLAVSLLAAGTSGGVLAASGRVVAGLVSPTNIVASSPASDVTATGTTRLLTDRASREGEGGDDLIITPPGVRQFPALVPSEQTTSGDGRGPLRGGLTDVTTSFQQQSLAHAPVATPLGAAVAFTKPAPAKPGSGADFVISEALPGFAAQYMRHAVLAVTGPTNTPGLTNVHFAMTEPSSLALLGVGGLVVLGAGLKWRSRVGAPRGTGSRDGARPARTRD